MSVVQWAEVIDAAADAVVIIGPDRTVRFANRAVTDLLGYDVQALIGERYDVLVPEAVRERHQGHHGQYLAAPTARSMGRSVPLRARRADGSQIDVDIALVPLAGDERLVAAFVRDISHITTLIDRMGATNSLFQSALAGAERDELERIAVDLARRVIGAPTSWLGRVDGGSVSVEIVAGDDRDAWSGRRIVVDPPLEPGSPVVIDGCDVDGATGSVLLMPLPTDGGLSVLGVHRPDKSGFGDRHLDVGRSFADTCAVVFELVELRSRMVDLTMMADHDRIARDLHDSAIQRLFVTTMRLESLLPSTTGPALDRIAEAVDELDGVMRDVRAAIFDLRRPSLGRSGLRGIVADEVDRFSDTLGFVPSLRFDGPVDGAVSEAVRSAVPLVVREALANVARHAHARRAQVSVVLDGHEVVVTVSDDGVGLPSEVPTGGGIDNLTERADALGGSCRVVASQLGGVSVQWRVPRRATAGDR